MTKAFCGCETERIGDKTIFYYPKSFQVDLKREEVIYVEEIIKVGAAVVYHDESGEPHNALITAVHSAGCVNLLYTSGDNTKTDNYGRQIERRSSCMSNKTFGTVHGNYWRRPEDEPNPRHTPVEV